jgi:DNA-binding transcriptional regulator YbjK
MTLDDELDRIFAGRDRNNMQPTIDDLLPLYASHPDNARVLYESVGHMTQRARKTLHRDFTRRLLLLG